MSILGMAISTSDQPEPTSDQQAGHREVALSAWLPREGFERERRRYRRASPDGLRIPDARHPWPDRPAAILSLGAEHGVDQRGIRRRAGAQPLHRTDEIVGSG